MSKSTDIQDLRALVQMGTALLAKLEGTTETAPAVPAQPKAEKPVRYRTAKQIETGRAKYNALWADLRKANPGVSGKDLARAHRAELAACWPKGTRKTKA